MATILNLQQAAMPGRSVLFPAGLAGAGSALGGLGADVTAPLNQGPYKPSGGDYPNVLGDDLGYVSRRVPVWRGARGKEEIFYGKHETVFSLQGANLDNISGGEALVPLAWVNTMMTQAYREGLSVFDSFAHDFVRDHAWYFPKLANLLKTKPVALRTGEAPWDDIFSEEEKEDSENETEGSLESESREERQLRVLSIGIADIRRAMVRFLQENMPPADYFLNNQNRSVVEPAWLSTVFQVPQLSPEHYETATAEAEASSRSIRGNDEDPHKNDQFIGIMKEKADQEVARRSGGAGQFGERSGGITPFDTKLLSKAFVGTREDYVKLRQARYEAVLGMTEKAIRFFRAPAEQPEQKLLTNLRSVALHGLFKGFYRRYFALLGVCDVSNQAVPAQSQMHGYFPSDAPSLLSSAIDKVVFQRQVQVRNYWGDDLLPNTRVGFLLRRKRAGGTVGAADRFLQSVYSRYGSGVVPPKGSRYSDRFGHGLADPFGGTEVAALESDGPTFRSKEKAAFEDFEEYELVPVRAGRSGRISVENMSQINVFGVKEYPEYIPLGTVKYGSTTRSSHGNRLQACGLANPGRLNKFATQKAVAGLEVITVLVGLNA